MKGPTVQKKFIKTSVTMHDRTQIETVFDYYLNRIPKRVTAKKPLLAKDFLNRALHYRVETFFFFPKQLGINPSTYPKDAFYNDIRPLVRFKEPKLGYKQLIGLPVKGHSPLAFLNLWLRDFESGQLTSSVDVPIAELRIFACSFVSFMFTGIDRRRKKVARHSASKNAGTVDAPTELAKSFTRATRLLQKSAHVLREYRDVLAKQSCINGLPDSLREEFRLVDEYCHYRFRDALARLVVLYEPLACMTDEAKQFRELVGKLAADTELHGDEQGYMAIDAASSHILKEHYMHRRGQLKRRIWSVLFLDIRTQPLFAFQRHLGAMVAAGLAALWALGAQIMIVRTVAGADKLSALWGVSGFLFMTAAIMAYVVKDRIKEIGRSYLKGSVFRSLPDNSESIYFADREGKRQPIGKMSESAHFLAPSALPEDIAAMRERSNAEVMGIGASTDQILHYTKNIQLRGSVRTLNRYELRAVHDILRFNIDGCLPRLGEPSRSAFLVDGEAEIHGVEFPKVYYLDLALKYIKLGPRETVERTAVDYLRLVLNKKGLVRIEKLA